MEQLSCEWCGQKASSEYPVWGHKETVNSPYVVSHQTHGYCIMAALARAEVAEAEAKAAADRIMVLEVAFANSHELNESLGNENRALSARIAELEAALDAEFSATTFGARRCA